VRSHAPRPGPRDRAECRRSIVAGPDHRSIRPAYRAFAATFVLVNPWEDRRCSRVAHCESVHSSRRAAIDCLIFFDTLNGAIAPSDTPETNVERLSLISESRERKRKRKRKREREREREGEGEFPRLCASGTPGAAGILKSGRKFVINQPSRFSDSVVRALRAALRECKVVQPRIRDASLNDGSPRIEMDLLDPCNGFTPISI